MKTIINETGTDIGMIISLYTQGSQWIANVTNNKIDYWKELKLHYSIETKEDAIEWAKEYIYDCECLGDYEKLRCEIRI